MAWGIGVEVDPLGLGWRTYELIAVEHVTGISLGGKPALFV